MLNCSKHAFILVIFKLQVPLPPFADGHFWHLGGWVGVAGGQGGMMGGEEDGGCCRPTE